MSADTVVPLVLPEVHTNGSGRERLMTGYTEAAHALKEFSKKFGSIEFNARDYYTINDEAYYKARDARNVMWDKIKDLGAYLEAHREAVEE